MRTLDFSSTCVVAIFDAIFVVDVYLLIFERGSVDSYSCDVVDSKPSHPNDFFGGTDVSFRPIVTEMLQCG